MRHEDVFGEHVTQAYASLIKSEVQLKYPNFYFERGVIMYDYDREIYVYIGFSDEEHKILQEAARQLRIN